MESLKGADVSQHFLLPRETPPSGISGKQDNMQNGEGDDNFTETFSGSREEVVNTFDEIITKCFGNYEESVEKLAPVQVRSLDEIMNECQVWSTITGNFGNILPIDWSFSRKMFIRTLNLSDKKGSMTPDDEIHSSEDEAVASDLDMHALILGGLHQDHECPVKTADEVIQEIDDMMQETPSSEGDIIEYNEALEKGKEVLSSPLYEDSPIVSALCNKFGCRAVCIAGSLIAITAFVLSTFSKSVTVMMITYGLLGEIEEKE